MSSIILDRQEGAKKYPISHMHAAVLDNYDGQLPLLPDLSKRDGHWNGRKTAANKTAKLFEFIYENRNVADPERFLKLSQRIRNCASIMRFKRPTAKDLANNPELKPGLRLQFANFCRCRLCPICASRKADIWQAKSFQMLKPFLNDYPIEDYRFIFLTLTVKNCRIQKLRKTIQMMNNAFHKLSRTDQVNHRWPFLGWIKATEVTRNKQNGLAHPHFHVLILAENYDPDNGNWITQKQWCQNWRKVLKVNYEPVTDVRFLMDEEGEYNTKAIRKAFIETLKYELKPNDFIHNSEWLAEYSQQVHRLPFINTGGVLRTYFRDYGGKTDLIHGADRETGIQYSGEFVNFHWHENAQMHVADRF